jgi:hypothetical protein
MVEPRGIEPPDLFDANVGADAPRSPVSALLAGRGAGN